MLGNGIRMTGLAALVALMGGCGAVQYGTNVLSGGPRQAFDGNYYRARLAAVDETPEKFVVTVGQVAQGISGAKEAGRYEAIQYCLENYGWSGIDWQVGPDTPDTALRIVDGQLTMTGECKGWV